MNGERILGMNSHGRVVLRGDRIVALVAVCCRAEGHDGDRVELMPSAILTTALERMLFNAFAAESVETWMLREFWSVAHAIATTSFTCAACAAKVAP